MATKPISLFARTIVPNLFVIATILLFFLFKPQDAGTLFYLNLVYTILLESIFFGWLQLLRSDSKVGVSPLLAVVLGNFALFYVVIGIGMMLLYSLVLAPNLALKWYILMLAVTTLLWITVSILLTETDSDHHAYTTQLKADSRSIQTLVQEMELVAHDFSAVCKSKQVTFNQVGGGTPFDTILRSFKSLTPNLIKDPANVTQLTTLIKECAEKTNELKVVSNDNHSNQSQELLQFAAHIVTKIEQIKKRN